MRFVTVCAIGALACYAGTAAMAQPGGVVVGASGGPGPQDALQRRSSLFVSPMGEPFRANASGARGIDLWFTAADGNYDSRISHDEFIANANAFFAHVDANQDGVLTSMEDTAYWRRSAPELVDDLAGEPIGDVTEPPEQRHHDSRSVEVTQSAANIRGSRRRQPAERPGGAQAYGLLGDAEPIMSCDSDFDRRVTLAEFDACAERRFAMLDANRDGYFTPDEAARYRAGGDVIRVSR